MTYNKKEHDSRIRLVLEQQSKKEIIDFLDEKYKAFLLPKPKDSEIYYAFEIVNKLKKYKEINKFYFDKYFELTKINLLEKKQWKIHQ